MRFEISVFGTPYYGSGGGFITRYCVETQGQPLDLVQEQAERWRQINSSVSVVEVSEVEGERQARWYFGIVSVGDAA